jgi:SPP1 gp7 family putative phage head morphogenesis protein
MNMIITEMRDYVATNIMPFLKTNEASYVADASFAMTLRDLMNGFKDKFRDITGIATTVATNAVVGTTKSNEKRFNMALEKGDISLSRILSTEGLTDVVQTQIAANVDLIQSLPDEYYKKISNAVFQGVAEGNKSTSLARDIQEITGVSRNRAKTIARDQTQKTNNLITEQRQVDLGIEEYIWITGGDGRVRDSHRRNNGKTFRWDSPPPQTGHPGHDVNCRCTARAVINLL